MRAIRLTSLATCLLLSSGCIVVSGPGGGGGNGTTGDLTVTWTFGGAQCNTAGVDSIQIQVTGANDSANKTVSCASFTQGITIKALAVGSYSVDITGFDTSGNTLYALASPQSVTVNAGSSNTYTIDVPATTGDLEVDWGAFGSYADCTAANIPTIEAILQDNGGNQLDDQTYSCGTDVGAAWTGLAPGTYNVILYGEDSTGEVWYAGQASVDVAAGTSNTYSVDLADNTGGLTVTWTITGSSACGSVTNVHLVIDDANGNAIDDQTYPCTDGGESYTNVPAGAYTATATGLSSTSQVLYTGSNANVQVTAGTNVTFNVDMN